VRADVEFTGPVANANVDVGTIDVQWKESGIAPPITSLTAYSLLLMTGGDEEYNMVSRLETKDRFGGSEGYESGS
jgi:hypothetical protein